MALHPVWGTTFPDRSSMTYASQETRRRQPPGWILYGRNEDNHLHTCCKTESRRLPDAIWMDMTVHQSMPRGFTHWTKYQAVLFYLLTRIPFSAVSNMRVSPPFHMLHPLQSMELAWALDELQFPRSALITSIPAPRGSNRSFFRFFVLCIQSIRLLLSCWTWVAGGTFMANQFC